MKAVRKSFPSYVTTVDVRKTSLKHLDNLHNAVLLFINSHPNSFGIDLSSLLSKLHNSLVSILADNSAHYMTITKELCRLYVQLARSPSGTPVSIPNDSFHAKYSAVYTTFSHIITLRNKTSSDLTLRLEATSQLQVFDRSVFALLSQYKVVVLDVSPNYKSISGHTFNGIHGISDGEILSALASMGITPSSFLHSLKLAGDEFKYEVMMTAGPNGKAVLSAREDATALVREKSLFNSFVSFTKFVGLTSMVSDLRGTVNLNKTSAPILSAVKTAKLYSFAEMGGKTRTVAMLDYWTQMALTPLHKTINSYLSILDNDGTFDQERIINIVRDWTKDGTNDIFSLDLTSATDLLPIDLQEKILSLLLMDGKAASNWKSLLVGRDFYIDDSTSIRYSVGQPMGARSSFPMLALTHHVITRVAAMRAGIDNYSSYVILGDDITLRGKGVAESYRTIMSTLGVPIAVNKSIEAKDGLFPAAEICKRIFIDGIELTSLPVKLIVKTIANGQLGATLQNQLSSRGGFSDPTVCVHYVGSLIDDKSLTDLLLLNAVPQSMSGLLDPAGPMSEDLNLSRWSKNGIIKEDDLLNCSLYTMTVEELKRVDDLLRQTDRAVEAIEYTANKSAERAPFSDLLEIFEDKPNVAKEDATSLPPINPSHPLVYACRAEYERVSGILNSLRSSDVELARKARGGLLDAMRNALTDVVFDEQIARGNVERSMLNKTLNNIRESLKPSRKGTMNFTLLLSHVGRVWSVHWEVGGECRLNSVKSTVPIATAAVKSRIGRVSAGFEGLLSPVSSGIVSKSL
jgi:hypothetical protein